MFRNEKVQRDSGFFFLQGNQNNKGNKDTEERALHHTLTLEGGTSIGRDVLLALAVRGAVRTRLIAGTAVGLGNAVRVASLLRVIVLVSANIRVKTRGTERRKHGVVVGHLHRGVETLVILEYVRLVSLDISTTRRAVALDRNVAERCVVIALVLNVLAIPVDLTTSPFNSSLSIAGLTSRPERELHPRGSLGELVAAGGFVPSLRLLEGAFHLAVDGPVDVVFCPVDFVLMPFFKGVVIANFRFAAVVICIIESIPYSDQWRSGGRHTVKDTLEVIVRLDIIQIRTHKLKIDLILGIRQQDKRRHNTSSTAALYLALDLSIPNVVVVREQRPHSTIGHCHDEVSVIDLGEATVHPVVLGSVAQVLGVESCVVEVVPAVGLILADGFGDAGVEGEGGERVTASETVGACSAFSIFCAC